MKKHGKILTLGGSVLAALCTCAALVLFWLTCGMTEGQVHYVQLGQKSYIYNPQTILSEIDAGRGLEEVPALPTPDPLAEPVTWKQSDFLRLTLVLVHSDWGEGWYLVDASFGVPCDEIPAGPQKMDFHFHKKFVQVEQDQGLGLLSVYIDARNGQVEWSAEAGLPASSEYSYRVPELDLGELIEAQEALRIAEEEGGRAFREGLSKNTSGQCQVSGFLFRSNEWWGWQPAVWTIWYGCGEEHEYMLKWEICIDALSGEVIDCD